MLWIYFIAPTVGMLAAAETFLRTRRGVVPYCAKLHHAHHDRSLFHHTPQGQRRRVSFFPEASDPGGSRNGSTAMRS